MKKALIIGALVLLVLGGLIVFVLTNLDMVVRSAIERAGSQATRTTVRVSSVTIELASGQGTLTGLSVANPPGFSSPDIFRLKQVSVRISRKSLSGGPIVIDQVRVSGPEVFCELDNSGKTNLDVLRRNMQGPERPAGKPGGKTEKEVRLIFRRFVFENGKVEVRVPGLSDRPTVVDLPRLELTDIGGKTGVTPAEAAKILATALTEEAAKAALRAQGGKALRKGAEGLLKRYLER